MLLTDSKVVDFVFDSFTKVIVKSSVKVFDLLADLGSLTIILTLIDRVSRDSCSKSKLD